MAFVDHARIEFAGIVNGGKCCESLTAISTRRYPICQWPGLWAWCIILFF